MYGAGERRGLVRYITLLLEQRSEVNELASASSVPAPEDRRQAREARVLLWLVYRRKVLDQSERPSHNPSSAPRLCLIPACHKPTLSRSSSPYRASRSAVDAKLTLGVHLEQLEHRTNLTCPLPFLLRPFPLLFLVILACPYQSLPSFVILPLRPSSSEGGGKGTDDMCCGMNDNASRPRCARLL